MIYIFSSCSYDLFKQNVLNACCFPHGHVLRVRYGEQYVPKSFVDSPVQLVGKKAVFVFADGALKKRAAENKRKEQKFLSAPGDHIDYVFLPIRFCTVLHAKVIAGIVILDIALEAFFDYGPKGDLSWQCRWDGVIKEHGDRPYLKPPEPRPPDWKDGYYVYEADGLPQPKKDTKWWQQVAGVFKRARGDEREWRSVIDRINASDCELSDCITYCVLGFFRKGLPIVRLWWPDRRLKPKTRTPDAHYSFRTGETILMPLLFYGQRNADAQREELQITFDSKAFSSVSAPKIPINGRYNEERILMPTVRGTDTVLSTLSIAQVPIKDREREIWAPQPAFAVSVGPSRLLIGLVVLLFSVSFFLASLTKLSDLTWIDLIPGISLLPLLLADNPKVIAGILFMTASWIYLRKFPLK